MNQAPPNKMFDAKYRAKWPAAVQALAHLEKCSERVALLQADGLEPDDPRLVAAIAEAKRASADYGRAEKTDEAMRFQAGLAPIPAPPVTNKTQSVAALLSTRCLCGTYLTPDVIRCPDCNNKRRAG